MNSSLSTNQPFLNGNAFIRSLAMWAIAWGGVVAFLVYQGQPGVICLTPMAWGLALPAGLNYVAFAQGRPGRNPFVAGAILGATLGLIYGLIAWGVGITMMPADPEEAGKLSMTQIGLIFTGGGVLIGALLSGMMAKRAATLQRRGKQLTVVSV
jgi:hypothetical protein